MLIQKLPPKTVVGLLFLSLVLLGWGFGAGYAGSEVYIVVRFLYFLLVALVSFATSWTLFPQTAMWLAQTMNPDNRSLSALIAGRMSLVAAGSVTFLTALVLAVQDVSTQDRLLVLIDILAFTVGISVFAASRFIIIGSNSQLWQEGRKGKAFIDYLKEANTAGAGIPPGAVPTVLASSLVAVVGMFSIVLQALVQSSIDSMVPGISGVLLLGWGLISWRSVSHQLDSEFYHTHGFYNELFRNPGGKADGGREPVPYASLYWVPTSLKPAVWLTFRQLDRKYPLGRILVLAIIVYWGLIKADAIDMQAMMMIPGIIILVKNLVLLIIDRTPYSSLWYRRELGSGWLWAGVHLVTGVRWLIPTQFFLGLTVWFVEPLDLGSFHLWLMIDVFILVALALIRSFLTSLTYAKNYR